ncbi:MAG: 7-carboxy-7-deazaguanine synthase QueE [Endomicrobium sp.]|nr:7-carboxy-7-deazaguanine synthase QueE [Endomicrobium sp.]
MILPCNPSISNKNAKNEGGYRVPVYEIFFSFQGEALYTGVPQIFVRFAGCNIKCNYCDTPYSIAVSENTQLYTSDDLFVKILELYKNNRQKFTAGNPFIAFTGGEPLIYSEFLKILLPRLKKEGFSIYLETNGTLSQKLKQIVKLCDVISMDFKLTSECGISFWKEHRKFLKIATDNATSETFIKCVITKNTNILEIKKSVSIINDIAKKTHLVLQPSVDKNIPAIEDLYKFYTEAKKLIPNVSLMVQMHKIYNIR